MVIVCGCIFVWFYCGCASVNHYQKKNIHAVYTVTFQLHVVGEREMFGENNLKAYPGLGGYVETTNPPKLWVQGYIDDKGVHVDDPEILGHEVLEVLSINPMFADPHN
jgi:hypothetical protein